jgi:radical SAM protein with 4Fe4S-binding SPASM domain
MNNLAGKSSSISSGAATASAAISLGLGLTNECNLSCSFCYRDPTRTDRLSLDQVEAVMERLPVRSVNLGTGENGMHPDFKAILAYLRTKPVKLTITSNGHSVAVLEDNELRAFHDIEFSLDYPTQAEQDAQRGSGNWELIHQQAERCLRLGIPVTIVAVMMKSNYLRLADVARIAKQFDAPLRVNVYQAVRSDIYALSYEEYWEGFRRLFAETDVIAIGEPLVRAIAGLPPLRGGCGVSTVRVTPRATTQPCVYWPGSGEPLSDLISMGLDILDSAPFEQARKVPDACQPCEFRESCHGGCAGRRRLQGALLQPDSYCPMIRGQRPTLRIRMAANRDLPKLSSSCTTVVIARWSHSTNQGPVVPATNFQSGRYNHADGQRCLSLVGEPDRASPGSRRALPVHPGHCRFRPRSGGE